LGYNHRKKRDISNGDLRMFVLRLVLLALCLLSLGESAQSQQRPLPRAQPLAQPAQPSQPGQAAGPDQRGTDQMPLSVRVLPSPKTPEEIAKEERERQERSEIEKKLVFETQRIADYTWYLALLMLFLVLAAAGQAALFVWQLSYMRRGMTDARTAADAARDGAIAAHVNAKIADKSMKLSTRAWVFAGPRDGSFERQGEKITFKVNVVNYGLSPARIKEIHVEFAGEEPLVDVASYQRADSIETNFPLGLGRENVTLPFIFSTDEHAPFIRGYVIYADSFGDIHESRFCRRIIASSLQTEPAGSPAWSDFN
jgi:hypothetical protein